MEKWTFRYFVTRDLMLFGIALDANPQSEKSSDIPCSDPDCIE